MTFDFVKKRSFWTHLLALAAGAAASLGEEKVAAVLKAVLALVTGDVS